MSWPRCCAAASSTRPSACCPSTSRSTPDPSRPPAAASRTGTSRSAGWDEVDADLVDLCRRERAVTAIGLDLSNYSDHEGQTWWDKEPYVEFAAYTDEVYPFSESRRQDLLDISEAYPAPWTGSAAGGGDGPPHRDRPARPQRRAAAPRERRAVAAELHDPARERVGRGVPRLVVDAPALPPGRRPRPRASAASLSPCRSSSAPTTSGRGCRSCTLAGRVSDHEASTERILHQRTQLAPVLRDAQAEETARDLRELRSKVRGYGFFSRSPERKAAEESAAAKVAVVCQQAGLPLPDAADRPDGRQGVRAAAPRRARAPRGPASGLRA